MSCEPDSWEELEQLTLDHHTPASLPVPRKCDSFERDAVASIAAWSREGEAEGEPSTGTEGQEEDTPRGDSIDQALKEALKNPRERANGALTSCHIISGSVTVCLRQC